VKSPSFLVDECLPAEVVLVLQQRGFDASELPERGMDDRVVWSLAATEGRILVTRDLDFPLRNATPRPAGLLLLRPPDDATAARIGALVSTLLDAVDAPDLSGQITVVSPGRYRQRKW
jgi:predicted nuclease of predicted toxin-antitoxin system